MNPLQGSPVLLLILNLMIVVALILTPMMQIRQLFPPVNQYANDTRFQLAGTEYFSRLDFTLVFQ